MENLPLTVANVAFYNQTVERQMVNEASPRKVDFLMSSIGAHLDSPGSSMSDESSDIREELDGILAAIQDQATVDGVR